MPVYDYACGECGEFALLRSIGERNSPALCPECGVISRRIITAPNLAVMNPGVRRAISINEKSRHAPRFSANRAEAEQPRAAGGCGCGPSVRKQHFYKTKLGELQGASKRTARPWMLGH